MTCVYICVLHSIPYFFRYYILLTNEHNNFSTQNEKTHNEIEQLDEQQNYKKLSKLLLTRLSFGTAGLRGCMQAGYNAMNDLVVIQTAQGMAKYIKKCFPSADELARGIIFGYDGRYNSKRYKIFTSSFHFFQLLEIVCHLLFYEWN